MHPTVALLRAVPACPAAAEALRQSGDLNLPPRDSHSGIEPYTGILPVNVHEYVKESAGAAAHVARETEDPALLNRLAGDSRTSVREALMANPNATRDMKKKALEVAFKKGSAQHQETLALLAPGDLLAEFARKAQEPTDGPGSPLRIPSPYDQILSRSLLMAGNNAVPALHAAGINLEDLEEPLANLDLHDVDPNVLGQLEGTIPDFLFKALAIRLLRRTSFDRLDRKTFEALLRTEGLLKALHEVHRFFLGDLLNWQRNLLLAEGTAEAMVLVVAGGEVTEEILGPHKDVIYDFLTEEPHHCDLEEWNEAAQGILLRDVGTDPRATRIFCHQVAMNALRDFKDVSLTPELTFILAESPEWENVLWRMGRRDMKIPPLPAAGVLAAKNPHAIAEFLAWVDPRQLDWTLEECEKVLSRGDLRPRQSEGRDPVAARYAALRLGDDPAAWKLLFTLSDDWDGSFEELLDTTLELSSKQ